MLQQVSVQRLVYLIGNEIGSAVGLCSQLLQPPSPHTADWHSFPASFPISKFWTLTLQLLVDKDFAVCLPPTDSLLVQTRAPLILSLTV